MKRYVSSEIRIRSKAEHILSALTDTDKLKNWWGVDRAFIQAKDNGLYTLTWLNDQHGIKFITTGRISLYNRRTSLELEDILHINYEKGIFGPCKIKFDISEHSNYSILTVTQSGFQKGIEWDWYYKAVKNGWPEALIMLKSYLET